MYPATKRMLRYRIRSQCGVSVCVPRGKICTTRLYSLFYLPIGSIFRSAKFELQSLSGGPIFLHRPHLRRMSGGYLHQFSRIERLSGVSCWSRLQFRLICMSRTDGITHTNAHSVSYHGFTNTSTNYIEKTYL